MVKRKGIYLGYLTLSLIFAVLFFSSEASLAALNGMKLCAYKLIPTLFPMMVLSGIIVRSGVLFGLSRLGNKIMMPLFGISGIYIAPMLIGTIGSAPAGASAVKGVADKNDPNGSASAFLLSSVVSVGFLVSAAGNGLLSNPKRGLALYVFQMISVTVSAVFMRPKKSDPNAGADYNLDSPSVSRMISLSIREAAENMLAVCGSVIFFSSLCGIAFTLPLGMRTKVFVSAFLELASGMKIISESFPPDLAFIIMSGAVGWSGLSMICQSISASKGSIPVGKYIIGRALSALICPILASASIYLGII